MKLMFVIITLMTTYRWRVWCWSWWCGCRCWWRRWRWSTTLCYNCSHFFCNLRIHYPATLTFLKASSVIQMKV